MPKPMDADRARRKELLEEKRAARKKVKEEKEVQQKGLGGGVVGGSGKAGVDSSAINPTGNFVQKDSLYCPIVHLPEDAVRVLFCCLTAVEIGRLTLTCRALHQMLPDARISIIVSRCRPPHCLDETNGHHQKQQQQQQKQCGSNYSYKDVLVQDQAAARELLDDALHAAGETGRVVARGKYNKNACGEFIGYARFLDESVHGYSTLSTGNMQEPILLPHFVQGRFVSASPEHSLIRIGGDGMCSGPGGSGVAAWGVGKRGQLGQGKRADMSHTPNLYRLLGGIGYGTRIVQVSAGGGLVRVAHSLLLTSTGRVMSFGTGQYGALGHGYSAANQLPDMLRPTYIQSLQHVRVVCVAAGELHSAVATSDGDVYTFGDGFCGQLGHADKRPQVLPKQITAGGLQDECVATITCGSRHTLAVTEEGEVFSWGLGHFGVLGRHFTPFEYDADVAVQGIGVSEGEEDMGDIAPQLVVEGVPNEVAVVERNAETGARNEAAELAAHLDLIANLTLDDSSDQCIPKVVDALCGIIIVGVSAGHRHSLFLDDQGALYSCGAGIAGCLGHGDTTSQIYPMRITSLCDDEKVRIRQMSAGVDMSMAVTVGGDVYSWGRTDGGRIGLGLARGHVTMPRRVPVTHATTGKTIKAVNVDCGYVHSLIVGLDGTLHLCGGVGIDGADDGQQQENDNERSIDHRTLIAGRPRQILEVNLWHRLPEPQEYVHRERWKKYGKYEVKGRSKMLSES